MRSSDRPSLLAALGAVLLARLPAAAEPTGRVAGWVDAALSGIPRAPWCTCARCAAAPSPRPPSRPSSSSGACSSSPTCCPSFAAPRSASPTPIACATTCFRRRPPKPFNFGIYYPREARQITFDALGSVTLLCNIHEQMLGYVLVLQNPFFARVGADGQYRIDGRARRPLRAGPLERARRERRPERDRARRDASRRAFTRGRRRAPATASGPRSPSRPGRRARRAGCTPAW